MPTRFVERLLAHLGRLTPTRLQAVAVLCWAMAAVASGGRRQQASPRMAGAVHPRGAKHAASGA